MHNQERLASNGFGGIEANFLASASGCASAATNTSSLGSPALAKFLEALY
jgi:hypothetical protein